MTPNYYCDDYEELTGKTREDEEVTIKVVAAPEVAQPQTGDAQVETA